MLAGGDSPPNCIVKGKLRLLPYNFTSGYELKNHSILFLHTTCWTLNVFPFSHSIKNAHKFMIKNIILIMFLSPFLLNEIFAFEMF